MFNGFQSPSKASIGLGKVKNEEQATVDANSLVVEPSKSLQYLTSNKRYFRAENVLTTNATAITISGLDLVTDKEYIFDFDVIAALSPISLRMVINGDETLTNYYQVIAGSYQNNNQVLIGGTEPNVGGFISCEIRMRKHANGKVFVVFSPCAVNANDTFVASSNHTSKMWTKNVIANVTSFTITSITNAMAIGSKLSLRSM